MKESNFYSPEQREYLRKSTNRLVITLITFLSIFFALSFFSPTIHSLLNNVYVTIILFVVAFSYIFHTTTKAGVNNKKIEFTKKDAKKFLLYTISVIALAYLISFVYKFFPEFVEFLFLFN